MTGQQLKNSILQMAVQGKLVPQDPNDEPASVLLERISKEKEQLIKDGKIKKEKNPSYIFRGADNLPYEKIGKNEPVCIADEVPFEIPESWEWVRWGTLSESIQYGYNAPAKENGRIKMVRISDIQDNSVVWQTVPYCEIDEKDIDTYLLKSNDILFARTGGTVGKSYLVKVVPHSHNVGTHDRCGTTVEPMIKPQWFVKMEELAKPAIEAVKNGDLKFVPERYTKTYLHWLENIRDWCISRQLWWGHRIPAYYCDECGEVVVARETPEVCPKCGCKHFTQDEDTLDTWFSSALWPFSTLGWPEKTKELDYFYPTNTLVTGYDIIFFWVVRMVFSGYEQTGKSPFDTVLIHGLVRDEQGRKMSKSLGNGINPLDVIAQYGADALRFTLITGNAPGNDMRYTEKRVIASRNFANKIWNASRFIMMNLEQADFSDVTLEDLTSADKWILSKLNTLAKDVTDNMEKYELGIAVQKLNDFLWEEFCDWYIEMVKPRLYNDEDQTKAAALWTLNTVLTEALKLLHPYMPFITEEIYCNLTDEESIMLAKWPEFKEEWNFKADEKAVETIKEAVRGIRNVRAEMNVSPKKKAQVYVVLEIQELK